MDAADPAPATPPKADSILYPEVVGPAGGRGPVTLPPYEGTEYKLGPFRLRPAQMHMEGIMVAVLAAYLVTAFLSRKANRSRAAKWFKANERVYREEFSGVGLGGDKLFEGDGGDEFVSYATGRRGVESAWSKVSTGGYDLLAKLYDAARGIADYAYDSGADRIVSPFASSPPIGRSCCHGHASQTVDRRARPADCGSQACGAEGHARRQICLRGGPPRGTEKDPRCSVGPGAFPPPCCRRSRA